VLVRVLIGSLVLFIDQSSYVRQPMYSNAIRLNK
jgi:hypothetical protein